MWLNRSLRDSLHCLESNCPHASIQTDTHTHTHTHTHILTQKRITRQQNNTKKTNTQQHTHTQHIHTTHTYTHTHTDTHTRKGNSGTEVMPAARELCVDKGGRDTEFASHGLRHDARLRDGVAARQWESQVLSPRDALLPEPSQAANKLQKTNVKKKKKNWNSPIPEFWVAISL